MFEFRRYLIPAGYWSTLLLCLIWLAVYWMKGDLVHAALGVAFLALSVALRAYGDVFELKAGKKIKAQKRGK